MITLNIRYFASLREKTGKTSEQLQLNDAVDITAVWHELGLGDALPQNILCAVNMEYVSPDFIPQDGDEVAFFPPVTGG